MRSLLRWKMNIRMLTIENLRTKNFTPEEFLRSSRAERDGIDNTPDLSQITAGVILAKNMQKLRDALGGKAIHITSGFRCEKLNKAVNGGKNSKHIQFLACDFYIIGMTMEQTVLAIKDSGVSVDRCFVERGCVHVQFAMNEENNENRFGTAVFNQATNKWEVEWKIRSV